MPPGARTGDPSGSPQSSSSATSAPTSPPKERGSGTNARTRRRAGTLGRPTWQPRPPRRLLTWLLLIGVVYLGAWTLTYFGYLRARSPAAVHLRVTGFVRGGRLTVFDARGARLLDAEAQRLLVGNAGPGLRLKLPIAHSRCGFVGRKLSLQCHAGTVRGATPLVSVTRSVYQDVSAGPTRAQRIDVTLPAGPRPADVAVQRLALDEKVASGGGVCIDSSSRGQLFVGVNNREAQVPIPSPQYSTPCESGLGLDVDPGNTSPSEASFVLFSVRHAVLVMRGRGAELTGVDTGKLEVAQTQSEVTSDQTLDLDGTPNLSARLEIKPNELTVKSPSLKSVRVDGEEMIPTRLQQNKPLVLSAFLGGVGLLWATLQLANFIHQRTKGES